MAKKILSPDIAAKYELVGFDPGVRTDSRFGRLDFTTMSISDADLLFKNGYKHLKLKAIDKPKGK